jgi:hypothetical protein
LVTFVYRHPFALRLQSAPTYVDEVFPGASSNENRCPGRVASAAGKPVASNIDIAVATLMLSDSNGGFESDGLLCGNGGIVEGGAAEFIARPTSGDCVCVTFSQEPLVFDNEPLKPASRISYTDWTDRNGAADHDILRRRSNVARH